MRYTTEKVRAFDLQNGDIVVLESQNHGLSFTEVVEQKTRGGYDKTIRFMPEGYWQIDKMTKDTLFDRIIEPEANLLRMGT